MKQHLALSLLGLALATQTAAAQVQEPISPIPLEVAVDPSKADLGQRLFEDVRLSARSDRSCASCHPLNANGMDGLPRARSYDGKLLRNTPTVFNVGLDLFLNWDGAFESVGDLTDRAITKASLMANTWPQVLAALKADPDYVARFSRIYPTRRITKATVLDALETFQRSLITPNSRFDKFLRGDRDALSADERRGYQLFKSYGCASCHQGVNVGGNLLQVFGVFPEAARRELSTIAPDPGRYGITGDELDRNVFRVPSLRNVAVTAPYFHFGWAPTLEDAVRTMARVQLGRSLSPEEVRLIVQFLGTLTGEFRGRPLEPLKPRVK
jgi:cytochrome c peroxidase